MSPTKYGAALTWTQTQLASVIFQKETTPTVTINVSQLIENNADRVALVIINLGASPVQIGFSDQVSATNGITLFASGGSITFTLRDDFTLQTFPIWAICPLGGSQALYVAEFIAIAPLPGAK